MSTTTTTELAEHVIATLRAQEAELRRAGIRHLSLFGSVARGEAEADSDVDLVVEFDPAAEMDLVRLVALERRIGETLGRPRRNSPRTGREPTLAGQCRARPPHCLLGTTQPTASTT
jgi:predicted nucleotidyltransferase